MKFILSAILLVTVRLHIKFFGLKASVERVYSRANSLRLPIGLQFEPEECTRVIAKVAALFPGRARCLEQSLTLVLLLRWSGLIADIRIGVRALPFSAHAWVVLCGQPVNEDAEVVRDLIPFQISV